MSVATELQALAGYLTDAYDKCAEKGATMPNSLNMANLTNCIDSIQGGGTIIPPEAGTLVSLVVGTLPTKTIYTEGDALDLTGLVVLGNYSNGFQYDVTNNCTYICNDPVTYSDTKIVAELDNVTLNIPITVNGIPVPAPSSVIALYHLDGNTYEEVSGTTGGSAYTQGGGKFGLGAITASSQPNLNKVNCPNWKTGTYTIEYWLRKTAGAGTSTCAMQVYSNSSDATNGLILQQTTSGISIGTNLYSTKTVVKVPGTFQNLVWYHFAVVFDNGQYRIYINGELHTHGTLKNTSSVAINCFVPREGNYEIDEIMACAEAKYTTNFEPPHAAYYMNYTVTFNTDGGSAVPSQTVAQGGLVTQPADPTKADYTFAGWYKESTFTTPWNFATDTATTNTTLYAKWEAITPSTVTLTYINYTSYDPLNVTFMDSLGGSETYSPSSGDSFQLVVPWGEPLDTIYVSADTTDDQGEPVAVNVLEEGQLEPTPFIDLAIVPAEDTTFEITDG